MMSMKNSKLELKKLELEKLENKIRKSSREVRRLESIEKKKINKLQRKKRTHNLILAGTILEITLGLDNVLDKPNYHSLIAYLLSYQNLSQDERDKLSKLGEEFLELRTEEMKKINKKILEEEITKEQIKTLLILSKDYLLFKYMRDKFNKNFIEYLTQSQYNEILTKIKEGEIKKIERNI